jgi:peroxiredoxin/outer membrane lipoprotein-sorting protein
MLSSSMSIAWASVLLLSLGAVRGSVAQENFDLDGFLAETRAAAEGLRTLYAHGTRTFEATDDGEPAGPPVSTEVRVAYQAPKRFRMMVESPLGGRSLLVCDGKYVWTFQPDAGEFTRQTLDPKDDPTAAPDSSYDVREQTRATILGQLMPWDVPGATFVRRVMLDANGKDVPCVVLELPPASGGGLESMTITRWMDEKLHVLRREERRGRQAVPGGFVDIEITTVFDSLKVDEALDPALFVFQAPTTAREVERLRRPSQGVTQSPWIGKPAPDFTLSDLKGIPWTLSSLKGRVVLLDFWATWCGPCKIELPHIQALYEEHRDDGLVVLGISNEPEAKVRRFLESSRYTFPSLVDDEAEVAQQYGITSIPTIMIVDRQGNVVEHFIGAQPKESLQKALAALGIH